MLRLSAESLGQIGDKRALNGLIDALNYGKSTVRWRAARALGRIGDTEAVGPLQEAQKDSNNKVKEESTKSLIIFEEKIAVLFEKHDDGVKQINNDIVRKKPKNGYSYFTPKRNFLRVYWDYYNIDLWLFIGNENIEGVRKVKPSNLQGRIRLNNMQELPNTLKILEKSYNLMKQHEIKNN